MDAVISMFDSWAIPQGREVINYYMPLEYLIIEAGMRNQTPQPTLSI